jgi:hypothetical protein
LSAALFAVGGKRGRYCVRDELMFDPSGLQPPEAASETIQGAAVRFRHRGHLMEKLMPPLST